MEKQKVTETWENFWNFKTKNLKPTPYIKYFFDSHVYIINRWVNLRGEKILEVGVGQGILLAQLAITHKTIPFGIDISQNACKISHNIFNKLKIKGLIIRGDAFSLPFRDKCFDCVICLGLVEHFKFKENRELIIKEIKRVAKKGGTVVLSVPKKWSVYTPKKYIDKVIKKWKFGYEREFTVKEFEKLGSKFFKNIEIMGIDIHPSPYRFLPPKGAIKWLDENVIIPFIIRVQNKYPKLITRISHMICLKGEV